MEEYEGNGIKIVNEDCLKYLESVESESIDRRYFSIAKERIIEQQKQIQTNLF